MNKLLLSILSVLLFCTLSFAQLTNGDRTLLHTQIAKTYEPGLLTVFTNMNFYTEVGEFIGQSKPENFSAHNVWLVAGNAMFSYGIIDHFDATISMRAYQDTHAENEFNLPDDLFLTLRAGSFTFAQNHFHNAFLTGFRIPTGEEHNYPFAEYASGAFEYGVMWAISYYSDPYLPERAFNFHFNMGYWNHNEAGEKFTFSNGKEFEATNNSQDFRMALAGVFPTAVFDFRLELSGILYLQKPDAFIYSAEEWAYLSPSIRYKPVRWASIDLGMDLRLSPGDRQWTTEDIPDPSTNLDLPSSYPAWKVHLGANFSLNLQKKSLGVTKSYEQQEAQEKIELFESVLEEREKADTVQEEIDNLKKIRKEAEKEIDELKNILEE